MYIGQIAILQDLRKELENPTPHRYDAACFCHAFRRMTGSPDLPEWFREAIAEYVPGAWGGVAVYLPGLPSPEWNEDLRAWDPLANSLAAKARIELLDRILENA